MQESSGTVKGGEGRRVEPIETTSKKLSFLDITVHDHLTSVSGAAVYERITDEVLQSIRPGGGRPSQTREGRQFRSAILIFNKE